MCMWYALSDNFTAFLASPKKILLKGPNAFPIPLKRGVRRKRIILVTRRRPFFETWLAFLCAAFSVSAKSMGHTTVVKHTLGQKTTFYPEITKNLMFEKCEFCEKWEFEIVNFVKNEVLKMWILWKMRFWKCDFCEKWDFEIVNFVKNEISEMWILWKMRF